MTEKADSDRRNGKPATPEAGGRPEEFDRFEALTRKLVKVSKSDLDKQLGKAKRGRSPRPT